MMLVEEYFLMPSIVLAITGLIVLLMPKEFLFGWFAFLRANVSSITENEKMTKRIIGIGLFVMAFWNLLVQWLDKYWILPDLVNISANLVITVSIIYLAYKANTKD